MNECSRIGFLSIKCSTKFLKGFKRTIAIFTAYNSKPCNKSTLSFRGPPWSILFFGTDMFSLESLKTLCAKLRTGTLISSLGIVSKPGSCVRKFAVSESLPIYDWPLKDKEILKDYDLGMVVSFGNLIPKYIIDKLPLGCINVHASLLPRWRGAAPIAHAIINGDSETGVTIMRIQPHRFDIGEIVRQYRVPIGWSETAKELERKLSIHGSLMLMECLRDLPRSIQRATPQPNIGVTYAPKLNPLMADVKWSEVTASSVYNLYRGLKGTYPLSTKWRGRNVKLHSLEIDRNDITPLKNVNICSGLNDNVRKKSALAFLNSENDFKENDTTSIDKQECGKLHYNNKNKVLKVTCADGNFVIINKLSLAGKLINGSDFYNGFLSKENKENWFFS